MTTTTKTRRPRREYDDGRREWAYLQRALRADARGQYHAAQADRDAAADADYRRRASRPAPVNYARPVVWDGGAK